MLHTLFLLTAPALVAGTASIHRRGIKYNTKAGIVPGAINVHLVPHSHDDVGWLKTVDQYATGKNNSIQHANTGLTIDTVLSNLLDNSERTFSYVEQAFFTRWVQDASDQQMADMAKVVASGQMTFINGAWAMQDEASPSYVDMIDNTALGHRLIEDLFGATALPTVTWQIDPFGHSATQELLSSPLSGFNALYYGRIDYQDRDHRINTSTTETIWRPSTSTGVNSQTLAGHLVNGYGPPNGLCWDEVGCSNTEPIQDDPLLEDYNVPFFVELAVATAEAWNYTRADSQGTRHLLWPMGSDFQFTNARGWYKNMDKLIHYVNMNTSQHGVNLLYSNPATYTNYKLAQDITWPLKTDDFMPYADGPHAMWSGYFTSRAALKHYVRTTSAIHQTSREIQFFAARPADMGPRNPLFRLERAIGVTQHHDGVSGTSKQHVAYDYARRLAWGREDAAAANAAALANLTGSTGAFATCDLANATICDALQTTPAPGVPVYVTAWNSRGQALPAQPFRIPVALPSSIKSYTVTSPAGATLTAQLLPASPSDLSLRTQYYQAPSATPIAWLCFQGDMPAAGFSVFTITPVATLREAPNTHPTIITTADPSGANITNGVLTLTFDGTGLLATYTSPSIPTTPLVHSWGYYNSSIGTDAPKDGTPDSGQPSGAYIFRPNSSTLFPLPTPFSNSPVFLRGPVVSEVRGGGGWVSQVTRLWGGEAWADIEYTVGPITNGPAPTGMEVISKYATPMATQGKWWTDSNCREMQPRVRDFRWSWNYTVIEPVAGNYVPVNCRITTKGANPTDPTLSVTLDRTQGGASMVDGSVELMVQRRLQQDDRRGVGEPLNEPGLDASGKGLIIRGTHRLSLDTPSAASGAGKDALQALMFPPSLFFSPGGGSTTPPTRSTWSGLVTPLPPSIHLLTVQALGPSTLLLRLAHLFESGEDAALSLPITLPLSTLFTGTTLSGCVEYTIPGSRPLASIAKRTVSIEGEGAVTYPTIPDAPIGPEQSVTIAPMQIRTWKCTAS